MKKIYSIPVFLTMMFLVACSEDFLDLKPIAMETEETFYKDFDALDMTATAAYGILCTRDIFDYYIFMGYASAADDVEVGGENTNDWPQFQAVDRLQHSPMLSTIFDSWGYCYKGIRMTNEFLSRVDKIRATDTKVNQALVDQRIAEMKFLRAFYHFYLAVVYGGVPIADKIVDPSMFSTPRNSLKEVYDFMIKDLKEAIPYLKEKSQLAPNYGRVSKGAARALLAKILLYESSYAKNYPGDERFAGMQERWTEALQYAEEVINSGEYQLVGINGERFASWRNPNGGVGGYRWIFTLDGDNSPESIWEIQNVMDGKGWTYTRGSYIVTYFTVRYYYRPSDPTHSDRVVGGWSFNLPTSYMVNAFGNQDSRETGLHSVPVDPKLDPRFATSIGRPGDTILVNDQTEGEKWFPMSFSNLPTQTISRKYECSPQEYWNGRTNDNEGPMNVRWIRYADVVLMAAEAAYMAGDKPKALNYINQIRKRARMSGNTGYPEDLTDISFEDIVHERRLELAMEGWRFFDLVRWRLAKKYISGITLAALGEGYVVDFEEGKHEFFPIPYNEIQLSKGALVQYKGWQ